MDNLKQDITQKDESKLVFMMQFLMEEYFEIPDRLTIEAVMKKHLGEETECFGYDEKVSSFAANRYKSEFKDDSVPPILHIISCTDFDENSIDTLTRSQMWDCPESEEILASCKYQVLASDMLGAGLYYKDRANMLMDCAEALIELFPSCKAVYFRNSGKMFTAEAIRSHNIPHEDRFIYFAVNVRFFKIEGTDDMLVDTLGMKTLFMPDLQYHFHGEDPNYVVNHAYNMLSYLYDNENPIESGHTIDGIENGRMSRDIQWKCQYEESLIQPIRKVIDVNMGEFASGSRN